jgi:hypothetical protein
MSNIRGFQNLDGTWLHGCKLRVTIAKYQKGGAPVIAQHTTKKSQPIQHPAHRDHINYAEVLKGQ